MSAVWLAERPRLLGLAYRVLGSWHDAEDVVSQAWLRLSAQPEGHVDRPEAWLTTVTTRLAIDRGRQLQARREDYVASGCPSSSRPSSSPRSRSSDESPCPWRCCV